MKWPVERESEGASWRERERERDAESECVWFRPLAVRGDLLSQRR